MNEKKMVSGHGASLISFQQREGVGNMVTEGVSVALFKSYIPLHSSENSIIPW